MNWVRFIKRFFIVLVLSIVGSTLLLGGFGFLLAGKEGMINAGGWGLILGIMGGLSGGVLFALNAKFWGDYAGRFGSDYLKRQTEGDKDQHYAQEDYSKWKL
jgi:hypothetical protein